MTNIFHQIDNKYFELTKSEKKIADYILQSPQHIISMSVQDLAETVNTSTASIVRFSKKMSTQGFQDLKIAISRYLPTDNMSNHHIELKAGESVETLTNKMISRATSTMHAAAQHINANIVDQVCYALKHAKTIFLFGYGASSITAEDLFQKFSRIGLPVRLIKETHLFMTTLATHGEQDFIIFITNQGNHSELQAMIKVANDYHINIITITSSYNNYIASHANFTIIYGTTDENELRMAATTSLFAQLFTVDILYYRFIALNYNEVLDAITQSKMALNNYHKHISKIKFKH